MMPWLYMLLFGFFDKVWLHPLDFDANESFDELDTLDSSIVSANEILFSTDVANHAENADCPSHVSTNEPDPNQLSDTNFWQKRGEGYCQNPSTRQQEKEVDPDRPAPDHHNENPCDGAFPTQVTCAGPEVVYPYEGYKLKYVGSCEAGKSLNHHFFFDFDLNIDALIKAIIPKYPLRQFFPGSRKNPLLVIAARSSQTR